MSPLDRTLADYANSGVTVGPHLVAHLRESLAAAGVVRACDLPRVPDGKWTKIAGLVIVRQRPGTAKGFCFLTLEDETGTANAVVVPDMFQRFRSVIHTAALLMIEGPLQKVVAEKEVVGLLRRYAVRQENLITNNLASAPPTPIIHIRAKRITELQLPQQAVTLTGHGYRMRLIPNNQQPNNQQPASLPKSHDFR
jgi:DNA polymerase III alpha subunit